MSLLVHRPTGRELRPKLMSMAEVGLVFTIIIGAGLGTGLWCSLKLHMTREQAGASAAITIALLIPVYLFIRSRLVRRGWIHPIGMMADEKHHAGCRCGR